MSLSTLLQKPKDRPLVATILGDAGVGKTRLAAAFPDPVFIRAEDGMQSIPESDRPDAFPVLSSRLPGQNSGPAVAELWKYLAMLCNEDHGYKTLVIDSVTALERFFIDDILARDGKAKGMNQAMGGYGNAFDMLAANHQRVRKAAGILNQRKGMNVIFIAHADVLTMRLPDMDDYMRYSLRLNQKHSVAPYVDDVDLVGFVREQKFLKGKEDERKLAISVGQRELIVAASASNVSKNRFGLTDPMPFAEGENPLAAVIPHIIGASAPQPIEAGVLPAEPAMAEDETNPAGSTPAAATEASDQ